MSKARSKIIEHEQTPVDDVRRVRERLDQEAGGDIQKLAQLAREAGNRYREKLGLKVAESSNCPPHRKAMR